MHHHLGKTSKWLARGMVNVDDHLDDFFQSLGVDLSHRLFLLEFETWVFVEGSKSLEE